MTIMEMPFLSALDSHAVPMPVTHPDVMAMLLLAMLVSIVASAAIVLTQRWHGAYSFDKDLHGIQKVHMRPVPRTGGVALAAGMLAVPLFGLFGHAFNLWELHGVALVKLLLAGMPTLLAGLYEDLTKKGSVRMRLLASFASALTAAWLLDAYLTRLDIWGIDDLLSLLPLSLAITAFAVGGVTNAINIVDGFHGVAGWTVVIVLAGMSLLAWHAGDSLVMQLAFVGIGATLGFLVLNYPAGHLFMGDGGAYLLGFWVAEVAVLTIERNPDVSAWQVLAICAYPIIEVVFSMYRRKFVRRVSIGAPDRLHMHSLFYRRVSCQKIPSASRLAWLRNASVAGFVAAWMSTATILAITIGDSTPVAVTLVLLQAIGYVAFYTRLIRGHWCSLLDPIVLFGWRPEHKIKPA